VHADTIGCMVTSSRTTAAWRSPSSGTHSARFAEGAHVTIFTDTDRTHTGHRAAAQEQRPPVRRRGRHAGRRLAARRGAGRRAGLDALGLQSLGLQVGDFVALDANPTITSAGYVKSRHLDDKAGIAAALGAFKSLLDAR
jgi:putative aminopeptidase FrvX